MICISTLTLRSKENSQLLYDVGGPETIVTTMKLHPTSKIVQVWRSDKGERENGLNRKVKIKLPFYTFTA